MSKIAVVGTNSMSICTNEEAVAVTRLIIHFLDAAEKGMKNIIIRTVDSDILTIVLEKFELITPKHDNINVCVVF